MKRIALLTGLLTLGAVTLVSCSRDVLVDPAQVTQQAAILSATFTTSSAWDGGFNGVITLKNTGDTAVSTWSLNFKFNGNAGLSGTPWGAGGNAVKNADGSYTITPNTWGGGNIPAGGSVTVSYGGTGVFSGVTACTISGASCSGTPGDTTAPTVSATVAPATLTAAGTAKVTATASDNVGVTKVEFFRNGTLVSTDTTAPYEYSQSFTSSSQNGTYAFTAKAFDAAGNNKTSTATNLTVNIPGTGDTIAPTVSVTASPTNLTAPGNINLSATASDNVGVSKVEFYRGTTLIATDTTAPYTHADSFSSSAQNSSYSYTAKAFDAAGNNKTSTAVTATVNIPTTSFPRPTGKTIVAYFANWTRNSGYTVNSLPADKVDVINYSFAKIVGGKCASTDINADYGGTGPTVGGGFNDIKLLKARNPSIKAVISIGGWSWYGTGLNPNQEFAKVAATDASRQTFVKSCIDQFVKGIMPGYNTYEGVFDGIDIDWEFPGECGGEPTYCPATLTQAQTERANWLKLLQEFRRQLDAYKPGLLLTVAVNSHPRIVQTYKDEGLIPGLNQVLNWINVMTYDYSGTWSSITGHNTPLDQNPRDPNAAQNFTIKSGLTAWNNAGIPRNHLIPGFAFYGRGWANVSAGPNSDGLFNPASGGASGGEEVGSASYRTLVNLVINNPAFTKYYDTYAQAPYAYDPVNRIFWSYDNAQSIGAKATYTKQNGYGGAMFWMSGQDDSQNTLLNALASKIH
ncbi:glycosyl hydrolase family 18 protein [Deinococcus cellulosilyticus]|uniref:glycosyl hydrolase family 18 protein n=1 Tax=Deinococcus cellulosilyticus TaxID=401558 RepID=UPI0016498CC7|nr:glycosyl hydrolase family 18 protein [Deinococcus cellulosilyticus]